MKTMPKINRKTVKRLAVVVSSVFLLLLLGLGYALWQRGRTIVTVENNSGKAMNDVKIALDNGDHYALGHLFPKQSCSERLFPTSDAAVRITFVSETGIARKISPEVYIESGYHVKLTIGKNGAMKWDHTGWLFTPPADNFNLFEKVRKS